MKYWTARVYSTVFLCGVLADYAYGEVLLLEPNIQGITSGDIVHATKINDTYFLDMQDMTEALRFQFNPSSDTGKFLEKDFKINRQELTAKDLIEYEDQDYFSLAVYEKVLPIKLKVNPLEMQLDVDSDLVLPTTRNVQNYARRLNIYNSPITDSFANYEFDDRNFTFPVIDLIYKNNQNFNKIHREDYSHSYGNYYQANLGMVFAGFDTQITLFGDDYGDNKLYKPGALITLGKTFLEEPANPLNLVRFKAGDIVSEGNNLFFNGISGRGIQLSSFKDLVVSADKTIDITGSMPNGWEAELYLNNQLIGFRQSGLNGRYEFLNIPVNYGLNDFKVVLYGPFGEVRTEERRYYSGTSPVSAGQFGYNISSQQPNRFIVENQEIYGPEPTDAIAANSMFYYGLSDYLTLIGGFANAENPGNMGTSSQFSTIGTQLSLNGVSLQYNTTYNFNKNKIGHHFDLQGDIYIGSIFARYEYYGDTDSPISYFQNQYLKDLFEARLTGSLPFINMPYYVSYTGRTGQDGKEYQEVQARLSPNFMRYYNITLENNWRRFNGETQNYTDLLFQATYGRLRVNGGIRYHTIPEDYLNNYGAALEYRWDKNTYVQANWSHDCRSNYSSGTDMDTFGIGIGRLFKFGGLTFNIASDTDRNLSLGLTYNISFGKRPDRYDFFANSENQMMNYGTIFAYAHDDEGNPVKNVNLIVNGRETASITDDQGRAVITNLEPYQKSKITVDGNNVEDLSLVPEWTEKKIVLRPGVTRPIDVVFNRLGGIEGQLENMKPEEKYLVYIKDTQGEIIAVKTADADGAFIFDGIKHGDYIIEVKDENDKVVGEMPITIEKSFHSIKETIKLK